MNMENTDMLENLLQNSGKVDSELLALLSEGANEEEVQELIAKKLVGAITALEVLEVKEALSEVLPFISQAYIAKTYFKKSRAWFTQRLNGNEVFGVKASFDANALQVLTDGLRDMRNKMDAAIGELEKIKGFDTTAQAVIDGSLSTDNFTDYFGIEKGE